MPGWQKFYEKYEDNGFEILSVAVDIQGTDTVQPFAENCSFTTVIDSQNVISNHFGFNIIPCGIFIDEMGIIRLLHQGFQVTNPEHTPAVEILIQGNAKTIEIPGSKPVDHAQSIEKELAETKFRLAKELLNQGKKEEALKELDEALLLNPDNYLIRKQRWYIRFPEKFHPTIDKEWQEKQYKLERAEEAAKAGPD